MARRRPRKLDLPAPRSWGGRRAGAGRKSARTRPGTSHRCRPEHDARHPIHVTLRVTRAVSSLRSHLVFRELREALAASSRRCFHVLHFCAQSDHLRIIVEADSTQALRRGLQGLAVRCARAINRALGRRGRVWSERYHALPLVTAREVRLALISVLMSFRKHLRAPPTIDPCSSGPWFDGWKHPSDPPATPSPIHSPRTWLGAVAWRKAGGPLDCSESPVRLS